MLQISENPHDIQIYLKYAVAERGISQLLAELLQLMLNPSPDLRIDAEKALQHSVFTVLGDTGKIELFCIIKGD